MDPIGTLHSHAYSIYIDSESKGKLGPSIVAWIIQNFLGEIIVNAILYIPFATNTQAENAALIRSLLDILFA